MDSRLVAADLAGGNRELLQTLAIEASTVLENARLLVEERVKQKIEEELNVARTIQQNLLPRSLPDSGWFRASGSSVATHQVGGDYFDVVRVDDECWAVVVADVSGKGVSSALLASLLQGALITASRVAKRLESRLERLNRYMIERTQGEKYATILCGMLEHNGSFEYINAGHCSPILVSTDAQYRYLDTTAMPVGMVEDAQFPSEKTQLRPGDKLVIYSDGVTEAANPAGEFFGKKRLREVVTAHAASSCMAIHDAILETVTGFISSAAQADDITLLVVEYNPELPA
jgi:sigma-B regulation protein RsbU (phosphoserine phosphatase)